MYSEKNCFHLDKFLFGFDFGAADDLLKLLANLIKAKGCSKNNVVTDWLIKSLTFCPDQMFKYLENITEDFYNFRDVCQQPNEYINKHHNTKKFKFIKLHF